MADITRLPFLRHLRGAPTTYVRHVTRGRVRHQGVGLSFWFRPLPAVLSEVPLDDRELPLLFHGRTADFQDVTVQATVTWRVVEPEQAAGRLDFGIDPDTGRWRGTPLEQLGGLLTGLAQQHALDLLAGLPLQTAITDGMTLARERLTAGLAADKRVTGTGIAVVGVRVVAVRPEPDVERALQTPAREQVQQDAERRPSSGGRWPSSASAPSARTSSRARSSWPSGRSGWSPSAARTSGAGPRRRPRPTASRRRPRRGGRG